MADALLGIQFCSWGIIWLFLLGIEKKKKKLLRVELELERRQCHTQG